MNEPKPASDLKQLLVGQSNVSYDDSPAPAGGQERRHPRIKFSHAPTVEGGELPFRLTDVSQSGFAFYTSRQLAQGTPLALGGANRERWAANVVQCRGTSFDASFIGPELRYQAHCQFRTDLDVVQVGTLLGELPSLTLDVSD